MKNLSDTAGRCRKPSSSQWHPRAYLSEWHFLWGEAEVLEIRGPPLVSRHRGLLCVPPTRNPMAVNGLAEQTTLPARNITARATTNSAYSTTRTGHTEESNPTGHSESQDHLGLHTNPPPFLRPPEHCADASLPQAFLSSTQHQGLPPSQHELALGGECVFESPSTSRDAKL